jgi:hypothetical protein
MLEDLLKNQGSNEKSLSPTLYAIEKADIATWPPFTASPTTNADRATRTGTFALVTAKKFEKVEIVPEAGDLKDKNTGGAQYLSSESELEVEVSGIDAAKIGWFKANKNKEMVMIVPDRNGLQVILGDEIQGCYITEVENSRGAKRGFTMKVRYAGKEPAVWAGVPPLTPAS